MTRRSSRGTPRHTEAVADALLAWLQNQLAPISRGADPGLPTLAAPETSGRAEGTDDPSEPDLAQPAPAERQGDLNGARVRASAGALHDAPLRLAHTDWLHHRLTITGPATQVAALRTAASGAGLIPWQLNLGRIEEDLFLRLVSPPRPQVRRLSVAGARILAGQLRAAVGHRHALAVARVGASRACPFDLHALLPVPAALLRRGPDDPAALAWLWTNWGTTAALRHVTAVDTAFADDPAPPPPGEAFRLSFFSADWSPWPALAVLTAQWPGLRFALRPRYVVA